MPVERPFKVPLLVEIDAFGLREVHESNIIDRVNREMQLAFGGNAHVTKVKPGPFFGRETSWIPDSEVVKEQVHEVGEVEEVPTVRGEETPTGAGLRSVSGNMLELRFPFPDEPAEGGTP